MKAFTDLEQSKKLAEILPLESADMWWAERYAGQITNGEYIVAEKPVYYLSLTKPSDTNYSQDVIKDIPCWSLATLMNVLPRYLKYTEGECPLQLLTLDFENPHRKDHCWIVGYWDYNEEYEKYNFQIEAREDEVIDACYKLVLKLYEHNLLLNKTRNPHGR